jgi:putative ABC transport system substrate-binding protein
MRRREFITFFGGAAVAWPTVARTQTKPAVVGWVNVRPRNPVFDGLVEGLKDAGFVEGQNLIIEYRSADDQFDRFPELAAELVQKKVSVIAAPGSMALADAAKRATSTIQTVSGICPALTR